MEAILAGGVAAAFSVKLTLDASGLRDGIDRAARLRRGVRFRFGSVLQELNGSFIAGVLAHTHSWRRPDSTVVEHIETKLSTLDREYARHPRECLDLLCVSDLASWSTTRGPSLQAREAEFPPTRLNADSAGPGYRVRFQGPHLSGCSSPTFLAAWRMRTRRLEG